MLFYATLLITSLIVTLIILGLYNLVVHFANKLGESHHRADLTAHLTENKYGKNLNLASSLWGTPNTHATPSDLARTHPASPEGLVPWGWPGNHVENHEHHQSPALSGTGNLNSYFVRTTLGKKQTVDDWKHNVGRPVRDDRPGLAGKAYKPKVTSLEEFEEEENTDS